VVRRDGFFGDRDGIWWSDGTGSLGIGRLLWVEGEFTLPSICDDLFARSSLL
jgi:hypothetical protein